MAVARALAVFEEVLPADVEAEESGLGDGSVLEATLVLGVVPPLGVTLALAVTLALGVVLLVDVAEPVGVAVVLGVEVVLGVAESVGVAESDVVALSEGLGLGDLVVGVGVGVGVVGDGDGDGLGGFGSWSTWHCWPAPLVMTAVGDEAVDATTRDVLVWAADAATWNPAPVERRTPPVTRPTLSGRTCAKRMNAPASALRCCCGTTYSVWSGCNPA